MSFYRSNQICKKRKFSFLRDGNNRRFEFFEFLDDEFKALQYFSIDGWFL